MSEIIFDSRISAETYVNETYHRTSSFTVGPNEQALLELTTKIDYYAKLKLFLVRKVMSSNDECRSNDKLEKEVRDEKGERLILGVFDDNKNLITDTLTVDRPGDYYLMAHKQDCVDIFEDCENPTIIEMTKERKCC